ncbi:MAG: argininosuccinate synthase [Saprospiraceae bacterium]|nr:argininosuccinate synthase [Saprospiraceae bacterium]
MKNKLVLAYSGGLDTSYCVRFFSKEKGMEVHAVIANNGGFNAAEIADMKERALFLGATTFTEVDITQEFYDKCIRFMLYGNMKRMDTYPLSVSSERMFQALAIARYAIENGIDHVAHGSTGAGNDQVRFDLIFKALIPGVSIHTPIRDQKLTRQYEINYLNEAGLEWDSEKSIYSINKGIWGTSIGGKETLTSQQPLPDHAYPSQPLKSDPEKIEIEFEQGEPVAINGKKYDSPTALIKELNVIGASYAIGRDIHVGDTIIGIKGRVAFEAPAALMLIDAHTLLEKHVLTKHQIFWKKQLSEWYGMMLHEGNYLEPTMRWIENLLVESQANVNGKVFLTLHPYRYTLDGIDSRDDLMATKAGVYGEENSAWSATEAKGFIHMLSVPLQNYYQLHKEKMPL